jgi:hypothetical protein
MIIINSFLGALLITVLFNNEAAAQARHAESCRHWVLPEGRSAADMARRAEIRESARAAGCKARNAGARQDHRGGGRPLRPGE